MLSATTWEFAQAVRHNGDPAGIRVQMQGRLELDVIGKRLPLIVHKRIVRKIAELDLRLVVERMLGPNAQDDGDLGDGMDH